MGVAVEYTIEEAEALLKRLAPDGSVSMTASECEAVEVGIAKLRLAVEVERGCGGDHYETGPSAMEALAYSLVGRRVRVQTAYGSVIVGTLKQIGGFRSLIVTDGRFTRPINLSLVESLEAERAAV